MLPRVTRTRVGRFSRGQLTEAATFKLTELGDPPPVHGSRRLLDHSIRTKENPPW
jgi:hypothetical protein